MSDELFNSIINQLSELGFAGRLSLYNNNEPLLDKRITQLIAMARAKLPNAYMEIKTNGRSLTMDIVHSMFQAGLDTLYVNDYREMKFVEAGEHSDKIKAIVSTIASSRRWNGHFQGHSWSPRIVVDLRDVGEVLGNRAGTAPNGRKVPAPINKPCMRPFEMMTINPEGIVALCSEDLKFMEPMGNLKTTPFLAIWHSEAYHKVREALLNGNRACKSTCAQCDYKGHTDEILKEHGIA